MSSEIIAAIACKSNAESARSSTVWTRLITLHQRKLELLRNIKKSMLDKMFV